MMYKLLPLFAFLAFISAPIVIGSAETQDSSKEPKKEVVKGEKDGKVADAKGAEAKNADAKSKEAEPAPRKKLSTECLASEEVIADLEAREKKLQEKLRKM